MYVRWLGLAAVVSLWTFLVRAEAPRTDVTGSPALGLPTFAPGDGAAPTALVAPVAASISASASAATHGSAASHATLPGPAASSATLPSASLSRGATLPSKPAATRHAPAQALPSTIDSKPGLWPVGAANAEPTEPVVVLLPIPTPPPVPAQPTKFDAPLHDLAGAPARAIARRVANFRTYRSEIPGATWRVDEAALFRIRADAKCKRALRDAGVQAHLVERELLTPVPSPVALEGPVAGVTFHSLHTDREVEMACELAVRLPAIAAILKRHGVRAVNVLSSYREEPRTSFHTFGLALDLASFRTNRSVLVVSKHFEMSLGQLTCNAQPSSEEGKILLAIACDLAASNLVSSVLTPNYNEGHRDHFHLDIRPDDPRVFLR